MDKRVIEQAEIRRLARLAHLELDDGEVARLAGELGTILGYVGQLLALDVEGVPPTCHVKLERLPLRPDEPRPSLDRGVVLDQAPATAAGGFAVPAVVDEDGSS